MIDFSSTSVAYFAEAIVSAALFALLFYYYKIYNRVFLFLWALSWSASVVSLVILGVLTLTWTDGSNIRHVLSFLSTFSQVVQLIFLLLGSRALISQPVIKRLKILFWIGIAFAVAILITLPYSFDNQFYAERYALRLGFRYTSMFVCFLLAAYWVGFRYPVTKTFGKKLIAGSFLMFALYQLYYVSIVIGNSRGLKIPIPDFFGIIEVVTISLMGLSMVIYLLEDEHVQLKAANQQLGNFLYRTSHDLRSPIATILSITTLAKMELKEDLAKQYMQMIEDRSERLDRVIGDILTVGRSSNQKAELSKIDFNKLIDSILGDLQQQERAKSIEWRYKAVTNSVFLTDPGYMNTIISNVLQNSVKYQDRNKKLSYVTIRFQKSATGIRIIISDNGQGMRNEFLPRAFEMFFRGNAEVQGTGLGLYIVHDLVSKLEGEVSVQSVFGEFFTVQIQLPNLDEALIGTI